MGAKKKRNSETFDNRGDDHLHRDVQHGGWKGGGTMGDKPRQATRGSLGFTKARKIQQEAMKADNLTIFSENVDTG